MSASGPSGPLLFRCFKRLDLCCTQRIPTFSRFLVVCNNKFVYKNEINKLSVLIVKDYNNLSERDIERSIPSTNILQYAACRVITNCDP